MANAAKALKHHSFFGNYFLLELTVLMQLGLDRYLINIIIHSLGFLCYNGLKWDKKFRSNRTNGK